jgi:hypothetical protein
MILKALTLNDEGLQNLYSAVRSRPAPPTKSPLLPIFGALWPLPNGPTSAPVIPHPATASRTKTGRGWEKAEATVLGCRLALSFALCRILCSDGRALSSSPPRRCGSFFCRHGFQAPFSAPRSHLAHRLFKYALFHGHNFTSQAVSLTIAKRLAKLNYMPRQRAQMGTLKLNGRGDKAFWSGRFWQDVRKDGRLIRMKRTVHVGPAFLLTKAKAMAKLYALIRAQEKKEKSATIKLGILSQEVFDFSTGVA